VDVDQTTVGRMSFTPDQRLLLLALGERVLRRGNRGAGSVPSSAEAAQRPGWTITKFNRKHAAQWSGYDGRGGPERPPLS
jgi:hypothetical protein